MKRNALIRIILWSIALALLCSTLMGGLALRAITNNTRRENARTERAPSPVYSEPAAIQDKPEDSTDALRCDPEKVHSLEIEWVAGNIRILPTENDEIQVSETAVSNQKDAMVWKLEDGQLSIEFCEDDNRFFGFGFGDHTIPKKELTIYVPMNWECRSLEIDAAAATVEVEGLSIQEVEFDGASGACEFRNCTVERMGVDTASGDIRFSGELGSLNCDAASADILAVLENVPSRIDVDTMSGDLDITLPENAGFSLTLDALSDKFSSEFEDVTVRNGEFIRGDGACRITVNAMSGDVMIRKAASPAP